MKFKRYGCLPILAFFISFIGCTSFITSSSLTEEGQNSVLVNMVVFKDDDLLDKSKKVTGRVLLGICTIDFSEMLIESAYE